MYKEYGSNKYSILAKTPKVGFSALVPDEGVSNDSESDVGESLNRVGSCP